jgi:hypothetical protein
MLSAKWKSRLIKIGIGVALTTCAVALTAATGGAILPVISGIVAATVSGAGISAGIAAVSHRITNGSWDGAGSAALEGAIDGAVDGFLTGSATAFVGAAANAIKTGVKGATSSCFIAGTAVLTASGALAIENINIGDTVLSYNEITRLNEYKEVMNLYRYEKTELIHLNLQDGQEIITTPEHPFYVANEGWIVAGDLRAGDRLCYVNGQVVIIEQIQHEILESPVIVYNFEVADNHNYFVSKSIREPSNLFVLVHNTCDVKVYKAKDGDKEYIGISNNVKRRSYEHQRVNPDRRIYTVSKKSYTRKEARALEQYLIEKSEVPLTNKINSIRPNTKAHAEAMETAEKLIRKLKWIDFK